MRREFSPYNIDVITVELGMFFSFSTQMLRDIAEDIALVRTAMTAGTKEFPLSHTDGTGDEYNGAEARRQAGIEFEESSRSAPTAKQVAKQIIDAAEKPKSPGKIYLGKNSFLFRFVVPYLPTVISDALFSKIMRMDLVRP